MAKIQFQIQKFSIGTLKISSFDGDLVSCDWMYRKMRNSIDSKLSRLLQADFHEENSPIIQKTIIQIEEYLRAERKQFDVPIRLLGTDFQKKVWNSLRDIPYGKTTSYSELASKMVQLNAVRAVANANGANTFALIVPCHRVVGRNCKLVGYAGGLTIKRKLLELEGSLALQRQLFDDNE